MATSQSGDWASKVRLAGSVLALLLLVIFIVLNLEKVDVDLLVGTQNVQLAFALIIAALLGFVIGYFAPRRQ
jgi:uncharacterized integral membrane protein